MGQLGKIYSIVTGYDTSTGDKNKIGFLWAKYGVKTDII
jgi:hypothetical protein